MSHRASTHHLKQLFTNYKMTNKLQSDQELFWKNNKAEMHMFAKKSNIEKLFTFNGFTGAHMISKNNTDASAYSSLSQPVSWTQITSGVYMKTKTTETYVSISM